MTRKALSRLLSTGFAISMVFFVVTTASAGRAWCRADPVLVINGDVIDIQVSSNLQMYKSATGPIEMVVRVPKGVRATVLLQDFGFGQGYDVQIVEDKSLKKHKTRAMVAIRAPSSDGSLPVGVHGVRVGTNIFSWLGRSLDVLWLDDAAGRANEWVVLEVK